MFPIPMTPILTESTLPPRMNDECHGMIQRSAGFGEGATDLGVTPDRDAPRIVGRRIAHGQTGARSDHG
jgi:hypothetical protein